MSKYLSAKCCQERLLKHVCERYQNLSKEEKKEQYSCECY